MSQFEDILYEKQDGVALITLNRPERMNASSIEMYKEMRQAIRDAEYDDNVRVVVLTGAGRGFCAGANMKRWNARNEGDIVEASGRENDVEVVRTDLTMSFRNLEKPVIAAVNGAAVGVGCDMTLWCDMRIASENARFGFFYVKRGLVPDGGGTFLLPKLVGPAKALELMITGDMVDGREAERIGLANKCVPHEELMPYTMEFAKRLAKGAPIAISQIKQAMYREMTMTDLLMALQDIHLAMNIASNSEDAKEGIKAFVEKREPVFKGE